MLRRSNITGATIIQPGLITAISTKDQTTEAKARYSNTASIQAKAIARKVTVRRKQVTSTVNRCKGKVNVALHQRSGHHLMAHQGLVVVVRMGEEDRFKKPTG
jgi:hypothetical protein